MIRSTVLFAFLFVLFLQFNEDQAAKIHHKHSGEIEESPHLKSVQSSLYNSWDDQWNGLQNDEQQEDLDHIWKRFSADAVKLRQRRRFGNTRYGRSLSNGSKWKQKTSNIFRKKFCSFSTVHFLYCIACNFIQIIRRRKWEWNDVHICIQTYTYSSWFLNIYRYRLSNARRIHLSLTSRFVYLFIWW